MFNKLLLLFLFLLGLSAVYAQSNPNIYVANNIEGTVSVINQATSTVVATIPGFTHPFCLSVSPDGRLLYVCNTNSTISAVRTATNSVIATISLPGAVGFIGQEGAGPNVAFSIDGLRAYAVTSGGGVNSSLYVIDTPTSTVLSSQSFGSTFLMAVAVSPDSNQLYLGTSSGVLVLDATSGATITNLAPGHDISDLALGHDGEKLYASDNTGFLGGTSGVLVVDTDTDSVDTTVPLPFSPSLITGLAVTPDDLHLYVEDFFFRAGNSTVTEINTADNSVNTTIAANGLSLTDLAITADGSEVVATNAVLSLTVPSTVAVIDPTTNTIVNSITVGHFADVIATQPSPVLITECPAVITQAGAYILASDLHCFGTDGIDIRGNGVTLMLNGHQIFQDAAFQFAGFAISVGVGVPSGNSHVNIVGPGILTGFNEGVNFEQVSHSSVRNVTSTQNFFGFVVNGGFAAGCAQSCPSTNNIFQGNTSTFNDQHGFTMNGANNNKFRSNIASNNVNGLGFLLFIAAGNDVRDNTANNNGGQGIGTSAGTGTGNNIFHNSAQHNGSFDLFDDNSNCDNNTWKSNTFGTANQTCIQ